MSEMKASLRDRRLIEAGERMAEILRRHPSFRFSPSLRAWEEAVRDA